MAVTARIEQVAAATLRELVGEGACIHEITLATHSTATHQKYVVSYVEADDKRGTFELEVTQPDLHLLDPA